MKDAFSRCHPAVNFIYFLLVIGSSMLLFHPVCLGVGFFCSLACAWILTGKKLIRTLGGLSVMMVLAAALNRCSITRAPRCWVISQAAIR